MSIFTDLQARLRLLNAHSRALALNNNLSLGQINNNTTLTFSILRKEVIQPHLPIRLPCYDFTPIISSTFDGWLLAVTPPASGVSASHSVTGGVYKARERIHRGMLTRDY